MKLKLGDLVLRDSIYFKKCTDVPFSGEVTGRQQGSFKNGKEEGPWVNYWDNGQLRLKGDYKNGTSDGPWVTYYENGQLRSKGDFKNGTQEGPWVCYKRDGTVDEEITGTYKDGVKVE